MLNIYLLLVSVTGVQSPWCTALQTFSKKKQVPILMFHLSAVLSLSVFIAEPLSYDDNTDRQAVWQRRTQIHKHTFIRIHIQKCTSTHTEFGQGMRIHVQSRLLRAFSLHPPPRKRTFVYICVLQTQERGLHVVFLYLL